MPFENTKRPAERPTEKPFFLGRNDIERSHPAFGMIGAAHVSGAVTLFGSKIEHAGFIAIRIHTAAEVDDGYLHRRPFVREHVAEVCLSEAQWARFVSGLNVGEGVPCTIRAMRTGPMVTPPEIIADDDHTRRTNDIRARAEAMVAEFAKGVEALQALVDKGKAGKAELAAVRAMFLHPVDYAGTNAQFFADSMTKHMEAVVGDVKAEIDAHVTRTAMQFPMLAGDLPKAPPSIEGKAE